jgi:hypothetical protein
LICGQKAPCEGRFENSVAVILIRGNEVFDGRQISRGRARQPRTRCRGVSVPPYRLYSHEGSEIVMINMSKVDAD